MPLHVSSPSQENKYRLDFERRLTQTLADCWPSCCCHSSIFTCDSVGVWSPPSPEGCWIRAPGGLAPSSLVCALPGDHAIEASCSLWLLLSLWVTVHNFFFVLGVITFSASMLHRISPLQTSWNERIWLPLFLLDCTFFTSVFSLPRLWSNTIVTALIPLRSLSKNWEQGEAVKSLPAPGTGLCGGSSYAAGLTLHGLTLPFSFIVKKSSKS